MNEKILITKLNIPLIDLYFINIYNNLYQNKSFNIIFPYIIHNKIKSIFNYLLLGKFLYLYCLSFFGIIVNLPNYLKNIK